MSRMAISLFLAVFFVLLGLWIGKTLFPKTVKEQVVHTVMQKAEPEVIERIVYDTTTVTKWKTRILYKRPEPSSVVEIPEVEIDSLNWSILSLSRTGKRVIVDAYHIPSSKLLVSTFPVENDFDIRLNQHSMTAPVVLLEKRNIFSLTPHLYLGYDTYDGPILKLRDQRIWKLHLEWKASQTGLSGAGLVRLW